MNIEKCKATDCTSFPDAPKRLMKCMKKAEKKFGIPAEQMKAFEATFTSKSSVTLGLMQKIYEDFVLQAAYPSSAQLQITRKKSTNVSEAVEVSICANYDDFVTSGRFNFTVACFLFEIAAALSELFY